MSESTPIQIAEDNSAAIAQVEAGLRHVRAEKHYEVKLRFLQQLVVDERGICKLPGLEVQLADFFANSLWTRSCFVGSEIR